METMRDFHEFLVVGMTRCGAQCMETFVVQFSKIIGSLKKREPMRNGGVAQLGEHLPCKQGVMGSNPIISTSGTRVSRTDDEN